MCLWYGQGFKDFQNLCSRTQTRGDKFSSFHNHWYSSEFSCTQTSHPCSNSNMKNVYIYIYIYNTMKLQIYKLKIICLHILLNMEGDRHYIKCVRVVRIDQDFDNTKYWNITYRNETQHSVTDTIRDLRTMTKPTRQHLEGIKFILGMTLLESSVPFFQPRLCFEPWFSGSLYFVNGDTVTERMRHKSQILRARDLWLEGRIYTQVFN